MNELGAGEASPAREGAIVDLQRQINFLEQTARDLNVELEAKARELSEIKAEHARSEKRALLHLWQGARWALRRPRDLLKEFALLPRELLNRPARERNEDADKGSSPVRDEAAFDAALDRWLATGRPTEAYESGISLPRTTLLLIGHEASRTGAPKALLELARELKATRAVRLLFVFPTGGGMLEDYEELGPCLVLDGRRSGWPKKIRKLVARLAQLPGPTKALANTVMTREFLEVLQQAGVPAVCWVHDSVRCVLEHCEGQKTMAQINRATKRIVYSSPANREAARQAFRLTEGETGVVRYGMQTFERVDRNSSRQEIVARLGLDEGSPLILGCGTVQSRKGVDLFVKAALYVLHLCGKDRPAPHFLWLGVEVDPAFSASVHALHRADALGANIHFLGEEPDPGKYFAACDLFLLTSRDDPYPFVTLEAMAWACPVLAFAGATGQEELFAQCEELLVPNFSTGEMAEKILDFLRNRAPYQESGRRAARNAVALLRWSQAADAFAALLEIEPLAVGAQPGKV